MINLGDSYFSYNKLVDVGFKKIGQNIKIKKSVQFHFCENIELGSNLRIDDFTILTGGGGLSIGDYVHISSHSNILGKEGIEIDDYVTIAPSVNIFSSTDDYHGIKLHHPELDSSKVGGYGGKVKINKHVIIGSHSTIMPNLVIQEGVAIGAHSLIKCDLIKWKIYAGIPAKIIKDRKKDMLGLLNGM